MRRQTGRGRRYFSLIGFPVVTLVCLWAVGTVYELAWTEAIALVGLFAFAVPIAVVRSKNSYTRAIAMLIFTTVVGVAVDIAIAMNLVASSGAGSDDPYFAGFFALAIVLLGGPFKVVIAESLSWAATSLRHSARSS